MQTRGTYFAPKAMRVIDRKKVKVEDYKKYEAIGIGFSKKFLKDAAMIKADAASVLPTGQTAPSIGTPIEFLREFLPEFVEVATQAISIDDICGAIVFGDFTTEEIIQPIVERYGRTTLYTDYGNTPRSSGNIVYESRSTIQTESGFEVGHREKLKAAKIQWDLETALRLSAFEASEYDRNRIGFYGYNDGKRRLYGLLNDPNLLPYETAPAGESGGTQWQTKTFEEIAADISLMVATLLMQGKGNIKSKSLPSLNLVVPLGAAVALTRPNKYVGKTVMTWIGEAYPTMRLTETPEFNNANGGQNIAYLISEEAPNGAGKMRTLDQLVPQKYYAVGAALHEKTYREVNAASYASVIVKKPWAIVRMTGI